MLRAVVTGGGSGMGREFTLRLAEAGAAVAVCDMNEDGMKQTLELARGLRGKTVAIRANVADENDVIRLMTDAEKQLGGLNALINNAGIFRDGLTVKRDRRTGEIRKMEAASGHHTPIVALTANAMERDAKRCLDAGMDDHVPKPVRIEKLRAVVERWATAPRGS